MALSHVATKAADSGGSAKYRAQTSPEPKDGELDGARRRPPSGMRSSSSPSPPVNLCRPRSTLNNRTGGGWESASPRGQPRGGLYSSSRKARPRGTFSRTSACLSYSASPAPETLTSCSTARTPRPNRENDSGTSHDDVFSTRGRSRHHCNDRDASTTAGPVPEPNATGSCATKARRARRVPRDGAAVVGIGEQEASPPPSGVGSRSAAGSTITAGASPRTTGITCSSGQTQRRGDALQHGRQTRRRGHGKAVDRGEAVSRGGSGARHRHWEHGKWGRWTRHDNRRQRRVVCGAGNVLALGQRRERSPVPRWHASRCDWPPLPRPPQEPPQPCRT